jgi:hypothetical protein
MALYSFVEVDRRFRGAYCLHHQGATSQKDLALSEISFVLRFGRGNTKRFLLREEEDLR